jgi:putative sterol carrier protein
MAQFLSAEWLDTVRAAAPSVGEASVECAVTGTPDGEVKLYAKGTEIGFGGVADADISLTLPYAEAIAIARGELEPSVAFMQGRMKTAGNPGKLLDLLAATATAAFQAGLEQVASSTDF